MREIFSDKAIEEITHDELTNYPVIIYGTPDGYYIDIMARVGEMFAFDDLEYEVIEYEGEQIKVATPETLVKMKKDTIRFKDKADIPFLIDKIEKRIGKTK